jgi:hypothetical protein
LSTNEKIYSFVKDASGIENENENENENERKE